MQKILRLLIAIFFITNSTVSTSVLNTSYLNSYLFKDIYEAETDIEKQLTPYWCGVASLQAIYKKLTKRNLSQVEIAKMFDIKTDTNFYHFAEFFNKYRLIMNMDYFIQHFPENFGKNDSELFTFQNYIKDSIINGAPVLLSYVEDKITYIGHTMLIDGIEIDEINPKNTSYWIANPTLGTRYKVESSIVKEWFKYNLGNICIGKKIDKNNKIILPVNFDWKKEGGITSDISSESKTIQLFKWSNYTNTWNEFKKIYKYFKFKDFIASAGGQGQTKKTTEFQQNTNDISDKEKKYSDSIPLVTYEYCQSPWCFATSQKATLFINSFFIKADYLYMDVQSYCQSFYCVRYVWTKLEIEAIEFYR